MVAMTRSALVCLALAGLAAAQDRATFADPGARTLLDRSRAALVRSSAFTDLRSLILRGRVRIPREGSRFDEGQVEIRILLPDRFERVDTLGGTARPTRDRGQFTRLMLGIATYCVPDARLVVRSTG